uniref:Integrase zinc-binding domain-containing protein n=1 Tax=Strigamia maritima TaxID=126957 RepID=T1IHH4_STRMM
MQYIKQARKIVNKNLEKISARSKKRFDKNRQEIEFYPGDLIYLKKPNRKVGLSEKLLPQYSGPWEIIMNTAPNNYQITNHTRKKIDIVNVERLKKFNKRMDKSIEDIDPPQVDFLPEIEIINEDGERQMEELRDIEENQEKEEITEKFINDNDQIALKPLFEPEEIIETDRKILKHSYNLREQIRK